MRHGRPSSYLLALLRHYDLILSFLFSAAAVYMRGSWGIVLVEGQALLRLECCWTLQGGTAGLIHDGQTNGRDALYSSTLGSSIRSGLVLEALCASEAETCNENVHHSLILSGYSSPPGFRYGSALTTVGAHRQALIDV